MTIVEARERLSLASDAGRVEVALQAGLAALEKLDELVTVTTAQADLIAELRNTVTAQAEQIQVQDAAIAGLLKQVEAPVEAPV